MTYDPPFQCYQGDIRRKWEWFHWHHRDEHPTRIPLGRGCFEGLNSLRVVWGKLALEIHLSSEANKKRNIGKKGVIVQLIVYQMLLAVPK